MSPKRDHMHLEPDDRCLVCASEPYPDWHAWRCLSLEQATQSYWVMRCGTCGLRWLTPFEDVIDEGAVYNRSYYEAEHPGGCCYRKRKHELVQCYQQIVNNLVSFGISDGVLDIGCGTGDFLDVATKAGIDAQGVEPSSYASKIASERGLKVWHGTLDNFPSHDNLFAAAHCSHVLEHVPSADAFLQRVHELLMPDALIYLEVPHQFDGILDYVARLRGTRLPFSTYSIHHHYFFTPQALQQLLVKHGFEVLALTTFLSCRRAMRTPNFRKWTLQALLWLANRVSRSGDVISVWARRRRP